MAAEAIIYMIQLHHRSKTVCDAMAEGIAAAGHRVRRTYEQVYHGPTHEIAVFYGYTQTLRRVMRDQIKAGGKAIYVDLGYWNRIHKLGHHKIVVNARHPTEYFMQRPMDDKRVRKLGLRLQPWKDNGKHILVAGMGAKAAEAEGLRAEQWEIETINALRDITDRRIIYRPKPSWVQARPIRGADYSPKSQPLSEVFKDCHAVVSHHSNACVESIVAGIPSFCWKGVAQPLSLQNLKKIEKPWKPENRDAWMNAISYCQWNIDEMRRGLPWIHFKNEGLI